MALPTVGGRLAQLWRRRPSSIGEFVWLAGVLVGALGLLLFFLLAGEVTEGDTAALDRALLLALRDQQRPDALLGPPWLHEAARDATALGGTAVLTLLTLAVIGYLALAGRRGAALLVAVAVGCGTALSNLLKFGYSRPRPDLVPHAVEVYSASFPSGHAMLAAVTYLTLGALLARVEPRWRMRGYFLFLAVLVTVLVGVSRVYLGVHWPTDVLAGWCVGAAWALLCWLAAVWLQRRGQVR